MKGNQRKLIYPKVADRPNISAYLLTDDDSLYKRTTYASKNDLPMFIRIGGKHALASKFESATHCLMDWIDETRLDGKSLYSYHGVVVKALLVPATEGTAVYYCIDQEINTRRTALYAMLSRHFSQEYSGRYGGWAELDTVFSICGDARPTVRIPVTTWKDLPKTKVSGEHHIHFDAVDALVYSERHGKGRWVHATRLPPDSTTVAVAGFVIWLEQLDDRLYEKFINTDILDQSDSQALVKAAKKLSTQAKSLQNLVEEDLRSVFEIDVLVNRNIGVVDWQSEKENRTTLNTARVSAKRVYSEALRIFATEDMYKDRPRRLKWSNYWDMRWQWSASGSIHSQYESEDLHGMPKDRALKNKFINLILTEDRPIDYYLNRLPSMHAWSSVKYEWGKMRAIYGTDLTSYVLAHFAFFNCEDVLPMDFPVGEKARPSFVESRVAAILDNKVPACLDFEDFNSQHSNASMAAVIDAYITAYSKYLSEEQIKAALWTKRSLYNVTVHDNVGLHCDYAAKGTLMSGWRLTTFMNSVLNRVYTRLLFDDCTRRHLSVHNGDDVLLGVTNFETMRIAAVNASTYNIRLQRSKCTFGGIAEFLRVDHIRGGNGQYLTRNIATLTHSRIESIRAVSLTDLIQAMEERLAEFKARGGSAEAVRVLRMRYYHRRAQQYDLSPKAAYAIKHIHRVNGGISAREDAELRFEVVEVASKSEVELPDHLPGVISYASKLRRELNLGIKIEDIIKRVRRATLRAVMLVHYSTHLAEVKDLQRCRTFRAIHGSFRRVGKTPLFGKAAMIGVLLEVNTDDWDFNLLRMKLANSRDPLALLNIIV